MFCKQKRETCLLFSGLLLVSLGLSLIIFWDDLQTKLVAGRFRLSETSSTYEPWIKSTVPIHVQYYFFNWTNPSNLRSPNYKPKFTEVGPYKFWEKIEKINVTWNENGTVSYRKVRRWHFDAEGSAGTLEDKITTINMIPFIASRISEKLTLFERAFTNFFVISTQRLVVTKTVCEFLYDGYEDSLLTMGRNIPSISSKTPYDKFGWFYKRNGSSTFDGFYNVKTGEGGMDEFGSVARWNYQNQTGFYQGSCGRIMGSGGEYWPWNRRKDTNIYLFLPDMCRYIEYEYSEDVTINGVDGYKYVAGPSLFDNGTLNPENECFCNGRCLASGVLNISICRFGAPVFTSYPHFYLADPKYTNAVVGMKPSRNLHENYISLEPTYGIPLDIAARIQINVLVEPSRHLGLMSGVQELVFPVFWLDQRVLVPSEKLLVIKIMKAWPTVNLILSIVVIALGIICLLSFVHSKTRYKRIFISEKRGKAKETEKSEYPMENEKLLLSSMTETLAYPEISSVSYTRTATGTDL